jgi:hypothetical protein
MFREPDQPGRSGRAEAFASTLGGAAENAWEGATDFITRHPVLTCLAVLGLGLWLSQTFLLPEESRRG